MNRYVVNKKQELIQRFSDMEETSKKVLSLSRDKRESYYRYVTNERGYAWRDVWGDDQIEDIDAITERRGEDAYVARVLGKDSQVVLFELAQLEAILSLDNPPYDDDLFYRLPFEETMLIFDSPFDAIEIGDPSTREAYPDGYKVEALLLSQTTRLGTEYKRIYREMVESDDGKFGGIPIEEVDDEDEICINVLIAIYKSGELVRFPWQSVGTRENFTFLNLYSGKVFDYFKALAVACIGFINCENVYLEYSGEVPEKWNRKNRKRGNPLLEPYYTCRIHGVNYESHETNTGTKHGFIYDVRGHFRRLPSGKTTWVRSHQRGLHSGGPYVPKVYEVDKKISGRSHSGS